MKTLRKQFNEVPLPEGWTPPPKGWLFIGMDKDLPRQGGQFMYGSKEWYGPDDYLKNIPGSFGVAAPAHLVRKLSTQKLAARKGAAVIEPRKPYDEMPIPVGIAQPPGGFVYVGEAVENRDGFKDLICFQVDSSEWWTCQADVSGGEKGSCYAAPAELCNRLPSPPDASAGHVKLTKPKPAEPVKRRFIITGIALSNCTFDTAEEAYEAADRAVKLKPDATIYVYQLRARFNASINVNRTDY